MNLTDINTVTVNFNIPKHPSITVWLLGLGWYREMTQREFTGCIQLQPSHCWVHMDSPLSCKRRWIYCKWQLFAYHSRDWQLVGLESCSWAGQKEACLPVFLLLSMSHTLFSLWSTPGAHGGYISSLLSITSMRAVDWATLQCSYVHLRYHNPAKCSRYHLCCCLNKFPLCFYHVWLFNAVSTCTMGAFIWGAGMGWTIRVTLKPVCLYAECQCG